MTPPSRRDGSGMPRGPVGDDRGQMFILAGLILALTLVTVTVVLAENRQSQARVIDAQQQAGLREYTDLRDSVRQSVRALLETPGMPDETLRDRLERLSDRRRLGFSDRDVNVFIRLNGTKERQLCEEDPRYASAGLERIAERKATVINGTKTFACWTQVNSDGILHDEDDFVVGTALDIGMVDRRFSVWETVVVRGVRDVVFFRERTATTVGATVQDPARSTDFPDDVRHVLEPPRSNIVSLGAYAAVPDSIHTGTLGDRTVNWSAIVANPLDDSVTVDRVEILETAGDPLFAQVVAEHHPTDGWDVGASTTEQLTNGNLQDSSPTWAGWQVSSSGDHSTLDQANDEDGCKVLGASNLCMKFKTEVDSGAGGASHSGNATLEQNFTTPSILGAAEVSFAFSKREDGALTNLATVRVVNRDTGLPAWTWTCDITCDVDPASSPNVEPITGDWYRFEDSISLASDGNYTFEMHADQNVPVPADGDNKAMIWYDNASVVITGGSSSLVWDASQGSSPVTVRHDNATDMRVKVRMSQFSGEDTGSFRVAVRDINGTWYNRTLPRYDTHRGPLKPTVSLQLNRTGGSTYEPR